ncbi:ABC transporter substrate-binding protein [Lapidilactobacillus wuchangensis]|uniref:ABC transporter substrate-binding protein n=1 Tax=Lapidilactobacillus wuchangensis TaxID=2486001 RepID=UPI0013DDCE4A|nr:extracellular solute-binding protein [Lapidilactobacillus wuchangensis]
MKKKGFLGLTIAALVLVLGGCGKKEASDKSSSSNFSTAARVKNADLKVYAPKGKNTDWLNGVVDRYNKKYDTKINLKTTDVAPTAITQKLTPLLVGHEVLPDISFIQDSDITGILKKFPKSFENLTSNGMENQIGKLIYSTKTSSLKATAPNHDLFGVPQDLGMVTMFYRHDIFEKAGIDAAKIKDWDELIAAGKIIKRKTGKSLLALDANGETSLVTIIMQQQNVPLIDKKGNVNMTGTATKNAIKIVDKLKKSGTVSYYSSDKDRYPMFQDSAVIIEGTWLAGNMTVNYPKQSGLWRMRTIVGYSADDQGKNPVNGGSSWYVGANSKNKTAALQLLKFAITDKASQADLLARGSAAATKSTYDSKAGKAEYPFFGNQKIFDVIKQAGNNAIVVYQYPYASDANNYLKMAVYDYWKKGDLNAQLKKNSEQLAQKYNVKVN